MAQIILLLFVLAGAAALGFVFAWSIQQRKQSAFQATNKALATELNDYKVAQGRLSAENETQKLSLANMENLLQNKRLAEKEEAVREIEVVREVPVLVFRDNKMDESTKEKAAKLVRAFKKGFSENKKKAAPPASS
jgi:hypothetical protein